MKNRLNIVALDGFTLNPGDLSWEGFQEFGDLTVYDRTPPDKTIERANGAEIVLTNKTILDRAVITALPGLRYIGVLATGYNVVDLDAARARAVPVTNVPEYGTPSVVQMVFALLLEMTQGVALHSDSVHKGEWAASADFCYWKMPLVELEGLTLGIVGYGKIGRKVARVARAFGMNVLVYDIRWTDTEEPGIVISELDDLFSMSDVVTLHCPLTTETKELINARRLSLMKNTAFLINTGRGPLVNDHDLAEALNKGQIAGAGLDVLTSEPPSPDNPLLSARNCYITPHIAWATHSARSRLMDIAVENVRTFLAGKPVNVVN